MGKKLVIDTMFCDLRKMQESTLSQYDSIRIDAMMAVTNPRARELMSRYPIQMDCMHAVDLDDETTLNTLNGKTVFTGRNTPNGRQYLIVNGTMTIAPDAGDALRQYMGLTINGLVLCPDSLATVLASKAAVNGKIETYPDGAAVLKSNAVIDRTFALRAEPGRLYWASQRLIAVDDGLDGEELAAKGVRFAAREAYLTESLAESMAPLFDPDTRLVILPDGTAVEQDDLTLNGAALRRLGSSLLVLGDLRLTDDCAEALSDLDYLQVEGDVYLPESMADALDAVTETILDGEVHYLAGKPLFDKLNITVDRSLLDAFSDGLTLVDCQNVTLDGSLTPADVIDHLAFYDCKSITCPAALVSAVNAVADGMGSVSAGDSGEEDSTPDDGDVQRIDAMSYIL